MDTKLHIQQPHDDPPPPGVVIEDYSGPLLARLTNQYNPPTSPPHAHPYNAEGVAPTPPNFDSAINDIRQGMVYLLLAIACMVISSIYLFAARAAAGLIQCIFGPLTIIVLPILIIAAFVDGIKGLANHRGSTRPTLAFRISLTIMLVSLVMLIAYGGFFFWLSQYPGSLSDSHP